MNEVPLLALFVSRLACLGNRESVREHSRKDPRWSDILYTLAGIRHWRCQEDG
jgi:hypothetical protein